MHHSYILVWGHPPWRGGKGGPYKRLILVITSPGNVSSENLHKLAMVMASMVTNMVYKLILMITTMVTPKVLLLKRNLMVEKSSKTGGVSFTSLTVRRI